VEEEEADAAGGGEGGSDRGGDDGGWDDLEDLEILPYGPGASEAVPPPGEAAAAAAELPPAIHRVGADYGDSGRSRYVGSVLPLHPLLSVDLARVASTGRLPPEMSMTPGEMLQLYDGMVWQADVVAASAAEAAGQGEGDDRGSREGHAGALRASAREARQRLRILDPESLFAPLDPDPMPEPGWYLELDARGGSSNGTTAGTGTGTGIGGVGAASGAGDLKPDSTAAAAAACVPSSLVIRDRVKAWEKLLLGELLRWACASATFHPPAAAAAAAAAARGGDAAQGAAVLAAGRAPPDESPDRPAGQPAPIAPAPQPPQPLYGPWRACLAAIRKKLGAGVLSRHEEVSRAWRRANDGDGPTSTRFLVRFH
jgi:hypothetical protein